MHLKLRVQMPELRTIVVPADPIRCLSLCQSLTEVHGLSVDIWEGPSGICEYFCWLSTPGRFAPPCLKSHSLVHFRPLLADCGDVLLIDDPAHLPLLYSACETVLVGGTLLEPDPDSARPSNCESLASPAVAGCTVLVGSHGGAISAMAEDLNLAAVAASEEAAAAVRNTGETLEGGILHG